MTSFVTRTQTRRALVMVVKRELSPPLTRTHNPIFDFLADPTPLNPHVRSPVTADNTLIINLHRSAAQSGRRVGSLGYAILTIVYRTPLQSHRSTLSMLE